MPIRNFRLQVRKKESSGFSLPVDTLKAEPFVNTHEGRLVFSGVPSGGSYVEGDISGAFEVGSKIYNQKVLNRFNLSDSFILSGGKITEYDNTTSLGGKFLSGTSNNGFVLADISNIQGNAAGSQGDVQFNDGSSGFAAESAFTYDNVNNKLSVNNLIATSDLSGSTIYSGSTNLYDIFQVQGGDANKTFVQPGSNITTGGTKYQPIINVVDSPNFNNISFSGTATGGSVDVSGLSGDTLISGSTDLYNIFQVQGSDSEHNKTFVQGGTNTTTGGTEDQPSVNVVDSPNFAGTVTASGLQDTSLSSGRVVFVDSSGNLLDQSGFEYNNSTKTLKTPGDGALEVGTGGTIIGSGGDADTPGTGNLTVHGDLTVFGDSVEAFTSELYVEDQKVEINYNPTGDTSSSSQGAGFLVQDGSGNQGTDVFLDLRGSSGLNDGERNWSTNVHDIRVRETGSPSSPNGKKVLAEDDILDGGTF